jgi:hypothetical protein
VGLAVWQRTYAGHGWGTRLMDEVEIGKFLEGARL